MTLSIKNGGYAFLIKLDLMFSMSLWKEFQLLQILNDLSIRHMVCIRNSLSLNWRMFLIKTLYQFVRLLGNVINKRDKELQHLSKGLNRSENFLSTHLSTTDFYILTKSITSYNKKSLQKSLYTQQKKLSSLTRDCNLPIFTANKTITNLTQYELSQEESNLLKAGLYFSIQPEKIWKSQIFTSFEKIHRSFLNNLKFEEAKSQIKVHLSYLAKWLNEYNLKKLLS